MRSKRNLIISATLVVFAALALPAHAKATAPVVALRWHGAPASLQQPTSSNSCFALLRNPYVAIVSQVFLDAPMYDSSGAADFTLTSPCTVRRVLAVGMYFDGAGPAESETVTFYANVDGLPGHVLGQPQTVMGADKDGIFSIVLPRPVKLAIGSYYVGVQANMDETKGGEWGWVLSGDANGHTDQWENYGGGFGRCQRWTDVDACTGFGFNFMVGVYR